MYSAQLAWWTENSAQKSLIVYNVFILAGGNGERKTRNRLKVESHKTGIL